LSFAPCFTHADILSTLQLGILPAGGIALLAPVLAFMVLLNVPLSAYSCMLA
jgi:hypothetical protein